MIVLLQCDKLQLHLPYVLGMLTRCLDRKGPHTMNTKVASIHWLGKEKPKEKGHINICKAVNQKPAMIVSTEKVRDDSAAL